jgi:pimeloyl-ACP methyl ester carboxylesterase
VAEGSYLENDGVRLACRDFGGSGPAILLLHGPAGHAGEWQNTAGFLVAEHRVVVFDARGHGRSERRPDHASPEADVSDVAIEVERLQLAPVVLIGQSLGDVSALLVAR